MITWKSYITIIILYCKVQLFRDNQNRENICFFHFVQSLVVLSIESIAHAHRGAWTETLSLAVYHVCMWRCLSPFHRIGIQLGIVGSNAQSQEPPPAMCVASQPRPCLSDWTTRPFKKKVQTYCPAPTRMISTD